MRFFFDVDGDEPDEDGIEFPDLQAAMRAAVDSLQDMAADPDIEAAEQVHITVRDDRGAVCRASLEIFRRS